MLVTDWSLTVWQSVSPWKGWGSSQYSGNFICDWSAMKQWSISALSPTKLAISCKVVFKRAPIIWRWVYRHHRPVCVCQSFHNKCSKSSDRLLKIVCKSSSKRDLLAIQGLAFLSIVCTLSWQQLKHFDLLYPGAATATVQLLTFWKLAKKWFDYERHPFYMLLFWLRINQQFVFDQSLLSCYQSPVIHRPVSTDRKPIAVRTVNSWW